MRTSDHGGAEAGGEKYQRAEKARRPASKIEKAEKSKKKKLVYFNSQERGKMMCPKGFSIKEVKQ